MNRMSAVANKPEKRHCVIGLLCLAGSLAWIIFLCVAGYKEFPAWAIGILIAYVAAVTGAWIPAARIGLALSPVILLATLFTQGLYFAFPAFPALILLAIATVALDGGWTSAQPATRATAAATLACGLGLGAAYLYFHFHRAPNVYPSGAKVTLEAPFAPKQTK